MAKWLALLPALALSTGCVDRLAPAAAPVAEVSEASLAQAGKVFTLISDIQKEYETLLTQATYPDDKAKNRAKQWIKAKQVFYEVLRVRHAECAQKKTRRALLEFVEMATGFVDVPESVFTHWDVKTWERQLANLSRVEALRDDFYVIAVALLKDVS